MDRLPWLVAQSIISYDLNNLSKDAQKALAWLAADILGSTGPVVSEFAGTQTLSPSLTINIGAGRIYQLAATDANPIGTFAADSTQILQQGYAAAQTIALNASGLTSGQSKWWLIQASFEQLDQVRSGDSTGGTRGFYNSENPASPLDGIDGLGGTIPTVRLGFANITAVAGAAGSSPVPPSPSAGCVPLYLIEVSHGQTAITTGEIQVAGPLAYSGYQQAPFLAGLLNQHHLGIAGTAPQIDLTAEVKNILPFPNLPASNASPLGVGGSVTLAGVIQVYYQGTGTPVGNVAGTKGDAYFDTTGKLRWECTATGSASTATWEEVGPAPLSGKYTLSPQIATFTASGVNGTFYQITPSGAMNANLPASSGDGTILLFKNLVPSYTVSIVPNGGDTLDNAGIFGTLTLSNGGVVILVAVSGGWQVS